jgi:Holliday junction resolvase
MSKTQYAIGRRYEYLLMRIFKRRGFYVIRAPASGKGSRSFFYPDIIALNHERKILVECKFSDVDQDIYLSKDRVRKLRWIADKILAETYVCVYFTSIGGFRCLRLSDFSRETEKNYIYSFKKFSEDGLDPEKI